MPNRNARFATLTALTLASLTLVACTTVRESSPQRTATEQLLISTAVDRAIGQVNLSIPAGTRCSWSPSSSTAPTASMPPEK